MDFASVLEMLSKNGNDAVKRPSWRGYVSKEWNDEAAEGTEQYYITFVKANGNKAKYTVTDTGSTLTVTGPVDGSGTSTTLTMDTELMWSLMQRDWVTGKADDFEAARSGNGTW